MSILARTAVLLLVLAGCDMIHPRSPPRLEESRHNVSGDRGGLLACYDDCKGAALDDDDTATCRKNCETAFKVAPTAADPVFDAAAKCMHECGDSRQCVKACKRTARRADRALTERSLGDLAACVDACQADRRLDDGDRWTCVRNCAQTTRDDRAPGS